MAAPLLVLTDFTPAADKALQYAAAMAAPLQLALVIVHIRRETLLDPDAFNGTIRHLSEGEVAAALAERVKALGGVAATVESTVDGVEMAVADAVRRHSPIMIILGKPDTEDTPDELVSSTSLKILRATRTPLLVIPLSSKATVPPQQVTIAADNSPIGLKAQAEGIQKLLAYYKPRVTVSHIVQPEDNDSCTAAVNAVQASGIMPEGLRVFSHGVRHRRTPAGILQAAAETHADLLVLVARRRSFLGQLFNRSVTSQVVLHGHLPMLLLPALD